MLHERNVRSRSRAEWVISFLDFSTFFISNFVSQQMKSSNYMGNFKKDIVRDFSQRPYYRHAKKRVCWVVPGGGGRFVGMFAARRGTGFFFFLETRRVD